MAPLAAEPATLDELDRAVTPLDREELREHLERMALEQAPETWATGDALGWCETVIDPEADRLHVGGDTELAEALIAALHERLFGGAG